MSTTTINVRLRQRRLPLLRAHGLAAPFAAMINMLILFGIMMWLFFKWAAIVLYVGGRGVYRVTRRGQYPKTTRAFHFSQEK